MSYLQKLVVALLTWTAVLTVYGISRPSAVWLTVEMSSSKPTLAQLFYDLGSGYNEGDSRTLAVPATPDNSFKPLTFPLPNGTILHLRLDPAASEGKFTFRHAALAGEHGGLAAISPADLMSYNQIQTRSQQGDEVTFTTLPGVNDPGITLHLHEPFDHGPFSAPISVRFILVGDSAFLLAATLWFMARLQLYSLFRRADSKLKLLAKRFSDVDFIELDSLSLWFYLVCLCCFSIGTVADLNGSSIGIYGPVYQLGTTETPIIGAPRGIRSDEWAFTTPAILNQVLRKQPFRVEESAPGAHRAALISNIPVLHFTTIFRPQFWAFFVLPLDYAFAAYWQLKALILLTGVFTFLLLITRCSVWSVSGALWYFFSSFTQWTYSWPSALPEMTGLICFTVVFGAFLTVGKSPSKLCLAAAGFASCAINFALCAYVPHLIPLFWLGVFTFVAWCIAQRRVIFDRQLLARRALAFAAATFLTAVVGFILYKELRVVIVATAGTIYPGARNLSGGAFTIEALVSHFFEWTETEVHYPKPLGNICEAAGFLWLAPVTLFLMGRLRPTKVQLFALAALWIYFLMMFSWLIFPVPTYIGRWLFLNRTTPTRVLPALGLANIAIVAVCMSVSRVRQGRMFRQASLAWIGRAVGIFLATFCVLCLANGALGRYFSWGELSFATCVTTALITLLVEGRRVMLAFALVVPQAFVFGAVNPLQRGLSVVTQSPLYHFVQNHKELLKGEWLIYSDQKGEVISGYLTMTGCDVYTGVKFLPDLDHFKMFAAMGLSLDALNRDALVLAQALPPNTRPSLEVPAPYEILWKISPTDPVLKKIGIKFFAFDQKPSDLIAAALVPLANGPIGGLWLFKAK